MLYICVFAKVMDVKEGEKGKIFLIHFFSFHPSTVFSPNILHLTFFLYLFFFSSFIIFMASKNYFFYLIYSHLFFYPHFYKQSKLSFISLCCVLAREAKALFVLYYILTREENCVCFASLSVYTTDCHANIRYEYIKKKTKNWTTLWKLKVYFRLKGRKLREIFL